jgi:COMPASS component SPP1
MTPSPVTTTPTTEFTPFDDAMPKVTSSGRVVTKSKKVAAAAAAAASISAKKRAVQMTKDRKGSLSRSQSVAPSASAEPEAKGKPEERKSEPTKDDTRAEEDDKLYCICRTKYDENLVMIACDKYVN